MENEENIKRKVHLKDIFNLYTLLSFLISILISGVIFLIVAYSQNFSVYGLTNGSFVAFFVSLALAILSVATNKGTFDVIAVGFQNMLDVLKKEVDKKYDLFEYRQLKAKKREGRRFNFLGYLLSALIFLIISLVFYFNYYN